MVDVLVHVEPSEDPQVGVVWWAEADEFPGFAAAADSLPELRIRVIDALRDIAHEQGRDLGALDISLHMAPGPDVSTSAVVHLRVEGELRDFDVDAAPGPAASRVLLPA